MIPTTTLPPGLPAAATVTGQFSVVAHKDGQVQMEMNFDYPDVKSTEQAEGRMRDYLSAEGITGCTLMPIEWDIAA